MIFKLFMKPMKNIIIITKIIIKIIIIIIYFIINKF